jgi:hypothetical protein
MYLDPTQEAITIPIQDPATKLLRNAANLIRTRGLAKGIQQDYTGAVCLHGALFIADTGFTQGNGPTGFYRNATHDAAAKRLDAYLLGRVPSEQRCPWFDDIHQYSIWNNQPERTAEDVIAALENA